MGRHPVSNEDFNARFLAWFSVAVVLAVLGFIGLAMFGGIAKANDPVAMLVIGGLMSILTMVIGYWFGSSAGSKRAADRLAAVQEVRGMGVPPVAEGPLNEPAP